MCDMVVYEWRQRPRSSSVTDAKLLETMERSIAELPLAFLATTTSHRDYAFARALSIMTAPIKRQQLSMLHRRFATWKAIAATREPRSEKAIGVLLLARALNELVQVRLPARLQHEFCYFSSRIHKPLVLPNSYLGLMLWIRIA